ncbi:fungal-specific transcription factor domain-containing protein [Mariannaea sp. PMI_226]|nr:fungal-specific transcription factor domain-containing protein [Mariannaea sp. PMI_226]
MTPADYSDAMQLVTSHGDYRQDICNLLHRMSLHDDTAPTLAVRHSMNAISYLHLQQPSRSFQHHMLAVSALRNSLSDLSDSKARDQAIAASMLLSIYEAVSRKGTPKDWSVYFKGCLMIFESAQQWNAFYQGDGGTLLDWVLYYNVFYKLSLTHWLHRTSRQDIGAHRGTLLAQAATHPRRHTIQSTLGCSLELLGFLSEAIDLLRDRQDPMYLSEEHQDAIDSLQRRIEHIDQRLCSGMSNEVWHGPGSTKHYTLVACIFKMAVIIYLDRVVRGSPRSSPVSRDAAQEAFKALQDLAVCERPFPMFILSLQADEESDRLLMLRALQRAKKRRALSNLDITEQMMQRVWSQQDLHNDEGGDALAIINAIFSASQTPPCLA